MKSILTYCVLISTCGLTICASSQESPQLRPATPPAFLSVFAREISEHGTRNTPSPRHKRNDFGMSSPLPSDDEGLSDVSDVYSEDEFVRKTPVEHVKRTPSPRSSSPQKNKEDDPGTPLLSTSHSYGRFSDNSRPASSTSLDEDGWDFVIQPTIQLSIEPRKP